MPSGKPAHRFTSAQEGAGDVDCEDARQRIAGYFRYSCEAARDAGVVQEDSEGTEFTVRDFEEADHVLFVGHIALDCDRTTALVPDFVDDALSRSGIGSIVDRDGVAACV